MIGRRDLPFLGLLSLLVLAIFTPILFTGRSFFPGDLIFWFHPWQAYTAQVAQAGRLPLWDPYAYLGTPLHGLMQTGTFYPGNLLFHLLPLPWAFKLHLLAHHGLAAFLGFLWLRRPCGRAGATAAAAVFAASGFLLMRVGNLNQTGTLAWWPSFFLFGSSAPLLGLAMACSLLAGYPQIWAGMAAGLALPWAWSRRDAWKPWVAGILIAAGLSAALLIPGLEMAAHSNRHAGMSLDQRLVNSTEPRELTGLASPLVVSDHPRGADTRFPYWRTFYLGFSGLALAVLGLARIGRRRALWAGGAMAIVTLLMLGKNNPLSSILWDLPGPLRFLRYPPSLAYQMLGAALPLIGAALRRRRWARWVLLLLCLELGAYGAFMHRTIPDRFFADKGPLVSWLSAHLDGHRFAASPRAALAQSGTGRDAETAAFDLKHRLYGRSGLPYRLHAATAMGEALMLAPSYEVMDFVFSRPSASEAMKYLPWLDARYLGTREPQPTLGRTAAQVLWPLYETANATRARCVPVSQGEKLKGGFEQAHTVAGATPLHYDESRPERFSVRGSCAGPGWVVVSNAHYPGWAAYDISDGRRLEINAALGAFQRVRTDGGKLRLEWVYRPISVYVGVAFSLLTLALLVKMGKS